MNNFAAFCFFNGEYEQALTICDANLALIDKLQIKHAKANLYRIKSCIYSHMDDFKHAYFCADSASMISDDIFSSDIENKISDLTNAFDENRQDKEKHELETRISKYNFVLVALSLISLVAIVSLIVLLIKSRRLKAGYLVLKQDFDKLNDSYSVVIEKNIKHIETQNRELTGYALKISQQNERINDIQNKCLELAHKDSKFKDIAYELKSLKLSEINWESFKIYFEQIHKSFFTALNAKHPYLTSGEVRMCAFIVMNISTKEIASLTNRSIRSIETFKYRLSKKLDLHENQSLSSYLNDLLSVDKQ
jgi:DNA-binding CsgD family transcriptional regulator